MRSGGVFDIPGKRTRLTELDQQVQQADFWEDPQRAQKVMQEASLLRDKIEVWDTIGRRCQEALELYGMAEEDRALLEELAEEARALAAELDRREFELAMSGPHDGAAAILSIHAGAGGTEAQDWAQMLLRMYLRWAERQKFKIFITDETEGEGAGIKSVTVEISGVNAYGLLKAEKGVHRLVRLSPFDSANRRHTSLPRWRLCRRWRKTLRSRLTPKRSKWRFFSAAVQGGRMCRKIRRQCGFVTCRRG